MVYEAFFGETLHNHLKKYNQNDFCCKTVHVHAVSILAKELMDVSYFAAQKVFGPKIAK